MKQQEQIKEFLIKKLGEKQGKSIFEKQQSEYVAIALGIQGKTPNQVKTLKNTILPRVALYLTLKRDKLLNEDAPILMKDYMCNVVGKQKHDSMKRMNHIPGCFSLFKLIFLKIMRSTDLQESKQSEEKDKFYVTITDCLWHNACIEYGCPELCRLFCEVDDVTYSNLKKIAFTRTKTLGTGGDCCDFCFYKK